MGCPMSHDTRPTKYVHCVSVGMSAGISPGKGMIARSPQVLWPIDTRTEAQYYSLPTVCCGVRK